MKIGLDKGANGTMTTNRQMIHSGTPADKLTYQLYQDAAMTIIWGDKTSGTASFTINGNGNFTVYGQIPAGQDVNIGSYSDTVSGTVN